jgi:hypothetical protein
LNLSSSFLMNTMKLPTPAAVATSPTMLLLDDYYCSWQVTVIFWRKNPGKKNTEGDK